MSDAERQYDYPVKLNGGHRAVETTDPAGRDRFECPTGAYTYTGGWPAFDHCPFCGDEL